VRTLVRIAKALERIALALEAENLRKMGEAGPVSYSYQGKQYTTLPLNGPTAAHQHPHPDTSQADRVWGR
jgi:hypothetical protein